MGPGRSFQKLLRIYTEIAPAKPPTKHLTTLKKWSIAFGWVARAEAYDAEIEQRKTEEAEARRKEILSTGFALDYERVDTLKGLAHLLIEQLYERGENDELHNLWVPDVKQIGSGDSAERVDIERYNAAIVDNLRGLLDDLAKETGGRKQVIDQSIKLDSKFVILPPKED